MIMSQKSIFNSIAEDFLPKIEPVQAQDRDQRLDPRDGSRACGTT